MPKEIRDRLRLQTFELANVYVAGSYDYLSLPVDLELHLVGNVRGLDTNLLVRYLVTDDVKQTAVAERLVQQSRGAGDPLCISIAC